jgi:hypothetical protein
MTTTPMTSPSIPASEVETVQETRLNVLLAPGANLLTETELREIPLLFRFQAYKNPNQEFAYLNAKQLRKNIMRISVDEPVLESLTDLPVITDDEIAQAYAQREGDFGLQHLPILQRFITERMTSFNGVKVKFRLMGIINTKSGELQPMKSTNQSEPVAPFKWMTGMRSLNTRYLASSSGTVLDPSLYKALHYYAALVATVNRIEGDRAYFSGKAYGKSKIFLTPAADDGNVTFQLQQRVNPRTSEKVIGLKDVKLKHMKGLGIFCGAQTTDGQVSELPSNLLNDDDEIGDEALLELSPWATDPEENVSIFSEDEEDSAALGI